MSQQVLFIAVGVVLLALIPIVPLMLRFRIKVLRWLHWNWFAELFERNFRSFTLAARLILLVGGLVLLVAGISRM